MSPSSYLRHAYNKYVGRGDVAVVDNHEPHLLQYKSCITGEVLNLRYAPGMHDAGNQVHIPASLRSPAAVFARYSWPSLSSLLQPMPLSVTISTPYTMHEVRAILDHHSRDHGVTPTHTHTHTHHLFGCTLYYLCRVCITLLVRVY